MSSEVPLILQLNEDCLWYIFSNLDLPDLLIAGSVCQEFEKLAQMFYKNYKSVDFEELSNKFGSIHDPGLSTVFKQLEPHMEAMKIRDLVYEKTFGCPGFSTSIFPNLQHIYLGWLSKIHEEYAKIFPVIKQIVLCFVSWRDESVAKKWFISSPHLKILKFNDMEDMLGLCLTDLKGIEELKINGCWYIKENYFEKFCQMNPQLKKLSFDFNIIPRDFHRRNTFLEIITKYLKNLESLVIIDQSVVEDFLEVRDMLNDITNYEILRDLPKITKLRVHFHIDKAVYANLILDYFANNNHIEYLNVNAGYKDLMDLLQKFSHLKGLILWNFRVTPGNTPQGILCSETLEELHLLRGFFGATDELKDLILQLKSLRLLNICGCRNFNSSFLLDMEECLHNRSQILEIAVNGTPLAEELKMEPQSDSLKAFLDRTKGKVKFSIDSFTRDGKRKKSFHEWNQREGGQRGEESENEEEYDSDWS